MILPRFAHLILSYLLIISVVHAQSFLPLQPHKLRHAQEVEREAIAKKDSGLLAEAYYLYSKIYSASNDILTGQQYKLKSLRILERRGDSYQLGRLCVQLADIDREQKRYQSYWQYLNRARGIFQRIHSDKGLNEVYNSLGWFYADQQNAGKQPGSTPGFSADSIWHHLKKSELAAQRTNDPLELAIIKSHIGVYLTTNRPTEALPYYQAAIRIYEQQKKYNQLTISLASVAEIHLRLGHVQEAGQALAKARKLYADNHFAASSIWEQLDRAEMKYSQATGNWKSAFTRSEVLRRAETQRYETDRAGAISRLNIEYETEKKETLLKSQQTTLALNAENQRIQQRFLVSVSALLTVAIGVGVVLFRLYRQNRRISQRNAQLVSEQNHRVKNNLQVLSSLLSLQANRITDPVARRAIDESQLRVETMALLQRRLYDGDKLAMVSLPDFLPELVGIVLQTYRYEHVAVDFAIPYLDLDADTALRVGLIVNELTTNACKYAFANHTDPQLRVSVVQKKHDLTLIVADNGLGLPEKFRTEPSPRSFGLRLIQMQVAQLNGIHEFTNNNGTQFYMHFTPPSQHESTKNLNR
jgi:two-component system, sensor histidine kinase PdtaS